MKVVKQGEWKQRITCRGCGSILQIEPSDIHVEEEMQDDEDFAYKFFVVCAVCSKQIPMNAVPEKIKKEVLDGRQRS